MSDNPQTLAALATLNEKVGNALDLLNKINGRVGGHEESIHDLDTRTAINSTKIETIEQQPSATRAVILVGSILGVFIGVAVLILRLG